MAKTKYVALIPAYEPGESLPELLPKLRAAGFECIVVDDGSGAAYREIFDRAQEYATVLSYETNQGKGYALKHGLAYIAANFQDEFVIVTLDSDGQHRALDALRCCRRAEEQPDALVLGSRVQGAASPLRSRFGNYMTQKMFWATTGRAVRDTQTGLRAFSSRLLPWLLAISGERYEYEMNVLLAAARAKMPLVEVDIATIYIDGNAASHFAVLRDSWRVYKELLKFSSVSLASFCLDYTLYGLFAWLGEMWQLAFALAAANILARFLSCTFNFVMNRVFVFHDKGSFWRAAGQYYLLAGIILVGNTLLLSLLVDVLMMNHYLAKLLTEISFFATSWLVQKKLIFTKPQTTEYQTKLV